MEPLQDCIVVGSGCTGAMAAQTLIEAGVKVTMLDVGNFENPYRDLMPDQDFCSIRKEDPQQYRFFFGGGFPRNPLG